MTNAEELRERSYRMQERSGILVDSARNMTEAEIMIVTKQVVADMSPPATNRLTVRSSRKKGMK